MKNVFFITAAVLLTIFLTSCNSAEQLTHTETQTDIQISTNADTEISEFVTTKKETTDIPEFSITEETITYELSEFTLANPDHIKLREDKDFAKFSFDDKELIELFDEAWYIKTYYFECFFRKNFPADYGQITAENGKAYTRSGISYDSFEKYLNNYFTEEYTEKLLNTGITEYDDEDIIVPYKNIDGELCYSGGFEKGTSPALDSITINITEQTDDEIIITVTARYCHPDTPDEEEFNDFDCIVKMTENGWRVDYLKLWYWRE